ncbi:uncharacterized protein MONBRDRAFT_33660 [Monosiga brevicollis MX1]|uniref:RING-type domain-containing protein n=1 Tax=Monosiga brevicollis TaxID=81824 RepID=A9V6F0_MONBE|nr:uncharacterized protein MONBRDRAFT_33660 [Monosiga brevicollis MX1]EDQ86797.1 predicted protein [Monosiga brevicollis MX1]|eukprot:XP_001748342.1 hypothetical protein [Monosiga brevicollis MX1]
MASALPCDARRTITCDSCMLELCLNCAAAGADLPTIIRNEDEEVREQTNFMFECENCARVSCGSCVYENRLRQDLSIDACSKCGRFICSDCAQFDPVMHSDVLPRCLSCAESFCHECLRECAIVCKRPGTAQDPDVLCSIACVWCRTDECPCCMQRLSRKEQQRLRLIRKRQPELVLSAPDTFVFTHRSDHRNGGRWGAKNVRVTWSSTEQADAYERLIDDQAAAAAEIVASLLLKEAEAAKEGTTTSKKKKKSKKQANKSKAVPEATSATAAADSTNNADNLGTSAAPANEDSPPSPSVMDVPAAPESTSVKDVPIASATDVADSADVSHAVQATEAPVSKVSKILNPARTAFTALEMPRAAKKVKNTNSFAALLGDSDSENEEDAANQVDDLAASSEAVHAEAPGDKAPNTQPGNSETPADDSVAPVAGANTDTQVKPKNKVKNKTKNKNKAKAKAEALVESPAGERSPSPSPISDKKLSQPQDQASPASPPATATSASAPGPASASAIRHAMDPESTNATQVLEAAMEDKDLEALTQAINVAEAQGLDTKSARKLAKRLSKAAELDILLFDLAAEAMEADPRDGPLNFSLLSQIKQAIKRLSDTSRKTVYCLNDDALSDFRDSLEHLAPELVDDLDDALLEQMEGAETEATPPKTRTPHVEASSPVQTSDSPAAVASAPTPHQLASETPAAHAMPKAAAAPGASLGSNGQLEAKPQSVNSSSAANSAQERLYLSWSNVSSTKGKKKLIAFLREHNLLHFKTALLKAGIDLQTLLNLPEDKWHAQGILSFAALSRLRTAAGRSDVAPNSLSEALCRFCGENPVGVSAQPCNCLCACRSCVLEYSAHTCPHCRAPVETWLDLDSETRPIIELRKEVRGLPSPGLRLPN